MEPTGKSDEYFFIDPVSNKIQRTKNRDLKVRIDKIVEYALSKHSAVSSMDLHDIREIYARFIEKSSKRSQSLLRNDVYAPADTDMLEKLDTLIEEKDEEEEIPQKKKSSDSIQKEKMPTPFCLSDREIVDLTPCEYYQDKYTNLVKKRDEITEVLTRIYFETQGGPTGRLSSRPGDIAVQIEALNSAGQQLMFINFYKNLKAFYEQLPPKEKPKNAALFQTLFEKLERARPLFLIKDSTRPSVTMSTKIQALKPGESVLLPGGFTNKSGGHSLLYEVKKESDGTCSFTIFNSGHGLIIHSRKGGKFSNARIRNIDRAKLNDGFFHRLFSFVKNTPKTYAIQAVYHHLQSLGPLEFDESFHDDQGQIGSCAYQCLLRWLKGQMGKELYHKVREYTLQALIDDYFNRFSGQARDDGSVRKISLLEGEVLESDVSKLTTYAKRCLQKIGRSIQIDNAIELANKTPDMKSRTQALLSIIDDKEIQKTILDDQDKSLVLLKIASRIASRGTDSLEAAKEVLEQAIKTAQELEDPEKKDAAYHEIAKALDLQGNDTEVLKLMRQRIALVMQISDPKKKSLKLARIADYLFIKGKDTEALEITKQANDTAKLIVDHKESADALLTLAAVYLFNDKDSSEATHLMMRAIQAAMQIESSKEREEKVLEIGEIIRADAGRLFFRRDEGEALRRIDTAINMVFTSIPDDETKGYVLKLLLELLMSQGEVKKARELLERMKEVLERMQDPALKAKASSNIGEAFGEDYDVFSVLEHKTEVVRLLTLATDIAASMTDAPSQALVLSGISKKFTLQGEVARANDVLNRITDPMDRQKKWESIISDLQEEAEGLFAQGKKTEALRRIDLAIEMVSTDTFDYPSHNYVLKSLAKTLMSQEDVEKAKQILNRIANSSNRSDNYQWLAWDLRQEAEELFSRGKESEARRRIDLAIEMVSTGTLDDTTKNDVLSSLAKTFPSEKEVEKTKEGLPKIANSSDLLHKYRWLADLQQEAEEVFAKENVSKPTRLF